MEQLSLLLTATMSSQFIDSFTHHLTTSSPSLPFATLEVASEEPQARDSTQVSTVKHDLHALLASFPHSQRLDSQQISDAISVLLQLETRIKSLSATADAEESALRDAIIGKLAVGLYAEAIDVYLTQATEVEAEAEWWRDIERSRLNTAWYLLQSMFFS